MIILCEAFPVPGGLAARLPASLVKKSGRLVGIILICLKSIPYYLSQGKFKRVIVTPAVSFIPTYSI